MIKIITLNIENPSLERAQKLVEWIKNRSEDVFVFTETKNSKGCYYLEEYFNTNIKKLFCEEIMYYVLFPKPMDNNYGVMCISKFPLSFGVSPFLKNDPFYSRYLNFNVKKGNQIINILGLYVPSRDQTEEKIQRKKQFLWQVQKEITKEKYKLNIVCGDLNIISKTHSPYYKFFQKWEFDFYDYLINNDFLDAYSYFNPGKKEYSWVGRTNNGYRYDYFFIAKKNLEYCSHCYFDHSTRFSKLSDHSAIILEILDKGEIEE